MTRRSVWILFICFHVQVVSSQTPDELLLELKQQYSQQLNCTPMFEVRHPGYLSYNAEAYPAITTDAECRISCIRDQKCVSYQLDFRPGRIFCWLQSYYSIEDLYGPLNAEDAKEYVLTVKCVNSTSNEQCTPLIEVRLRNLNTYLARAQPSVQSEMECREICLKDQECMSYQINSKPDPADDPFCYIQKDLGTLNKNQVYMAEEVKEYFVVDRCLDKYVVSYNEDCSPIFKKLHKEVSKTATPYPFITTEQLCRLKCLFATDCLSYQIDRNPGAPFCLIQTNGDNLEEHAARDLVTEYVLVDSCTDKPLEKTDPDCKPFIIQKPYPGVSLDAEPHAEVTNYEDCQSLCLATPTCVAFQNTSSSVYCWIQNDWNQLLPNQGYINELSNEYVVVRKCSKEGPMPSTTTLSAETTSE